MWFVKDFYLFSVQQCVDVEYLVIVEFFDINVLDGQGYLSEYKILFLNLSEESRMF